MREIGLPISPPCTQGLRTGTFSFLNFYIRRIRRIFPALALILLAAFSFGWIALFADEYRQLGKHIAAGAGFVSNFAFWNESGYFDNSATTKPLLHLWSLGVEEQFYLIWPLLVWLFWRWRLLAVTVTIAVISFCFNVKFVGVDPVAAFFLPQARFWELMVGSALAIRATDLARAPITVREACSLTGAALIVISLIVIGAARPFPGWWGLLPVFGTALVIAGGAQAWLNRAVLSSRSFVWLGLISYPLYLWHWPLLSFSHIVNGNTPSIAVRLILMAASVALAWATFRFLELPIRRGAFGGNKALALSATMLVIGCIGFSLFALDGLASRPSVKHLENVAAQFGKWKYDKNDICLKIFPFEEAASYGWWFCMANKDKPPTLLLLGNSHANALYPGFAATFGRQSILHIGTCGAELAWADFTLPPNHPCYGDRQLHQEVFINGIIAAGSVKYVVIDGLDPHPSREKLAGLKRRVQFIEGQSAKVVVFVPHVGLRDSNVRDCFARQFGLSPRSCQLGIGARATLNTGFRPALDQLVGTGALIFDPNDLFCDKATCSMIRDGMPLLRDESQHITEYGSEQIAALFANWATKNLPELMH